MIRIITDSSSDMSLKRCKELNIDLIPLRVHFGQESYRSLIEISNQEFYEKLAGSEALPTTSQITPGEFEQIFTEYTAQGDEVIGLFISSKMSGTYQSALVAKELTGSDKIHIVDTMTVTFALALLVEEAVKMRDSGSLTAAEIAVRIAELVPRTRLWAAVDTLEYLKKGGRLSPTSAWVAGILGICPIITISGGLVATAGKARGRAASYKLIDGLLDKSEISSDYSLTIGHSNSPKNLEAFNDFFHSRLKKREINICDIGSIVGTHVGPGACGIAYISK